MCLEEEETARMLMSMKLHGDLVVEIISHLPLKLAVQCKLVSKNFNRWISHPKFSQTLFQHQKVSTLVLAYTSDSVNRRDLQTKIFRNLSIPIIDPHQTEPFGFRFVSACKGLLLLAFIELATFCVFNPITGAHQLIPYPENYRHTVTGNARLFVDYPTSDQYKLVTAEKLAQGEGYKFRLLSSEERSGLWHEFQFRMTLGNNISKPTYVHDSSLHWLTADGRVLAFDTKRQEATIIYPPKFLNIHPKPKAKGRRRLRRRIYASAKWLVLVQGQLILVRNYYKSTAIAVYNSESRNWRVSPTLEQSICAILPNFIDGKLLLFLVGGGYLYDYDFDLNTYKKAAVYSEDNGIPSVIYPFKPSLASVHETLSGTVDAKHLPGIIAALDELKRGITQGMS